MSRPTSRLFRFFWGVVAFFSFGFLLVLMTSGEAYLSLAGAFVSGMAFAVALALALPERTDSDAAADAHRRAQRFHDFAQLSADWCWEQDSEFRFVAGEGFGLDGLVKPLARVLGKTRWELPIEGVSEEEWQAHRDTLERHQPFRDFIYCWRQENGELRWLSVSGRPVFDDYGTFKGYRGIGRDITEQKGVEQALRRTEDRFRHLAEMSADWYWEQDATFTFTKMSGGAIHRGHFRTAEAIGRKRWELPIVDQRGSDWQKHRQMLERHLPFRDFTYRILSSDGELHWYSVSGKPVFDGEGQFAGYFGIGRDITHQKQADDARRAMEEQLRAVFEEAPDGLAQFGGRGHWIRVNKALCGMLGYSPHELLVLPLAALTYPEELRSILSMRARLISNWPSPISAEKPFRHRTGKTVWVNFTATLLKGFEGRPRYFIVSARDATARRHAEIAMRASEERYRTLLDLAPDAIFVHSDGEIRLVNRSAVRLLDAPSADAVIGRRFLDFIHPACRDMLQERLNRLCEGMGTLPSAEEKFLTVNGQTVEVEATTARVVFDDGPAILSVARGIRTSKCGEATLRESEAPLRGLFETVTAIAVRSYGADRRVLFWNKACENFFGYTAGEAIGRRIEELILPHEDWRDFISETQKFLESNTAPPPGEFRARRKDGSEVTVYSSRFMLQGAGGQREIYCIDVDLARIRRS